MSTEKDSFYKEYYESLLDDEGRDLTLDEITGDGISLSSIEHPINDGMPVPDDINEGSLEDSELGKMIKENLSLDIENCKLYKLRKEYFFLEKEVKKRFEPLEINYNKFTVLWVIYNICTKNEKEKSNKSMINLVAKLINMDRRTLMPFINELVALKLITKLIITMPHVHYYYELTDEGMKKLTQGLKIWREFNE